MSGFTPLDRDAQRLIRGRIIATLYVGFHQDWLSQELLHTRVCGGPRDPDYKRPLEFAGFLTYLEEAGYVNRREENDPLVDEPRTFFRLSKAGVDLYEGVRAADPGVEIRR